MTAQSDSTPAHEEVDPIIQLFALAEALHHVAETLPETQGGLMCLLQLLGNDVEACADTLQKSETA